MSESPTTRLSLLIRLRDTHDRLAWEQFVGLYAPLVYGFARRNGLQDADAADVAQDVGLLVGLLGELLEHRLLQRICLEGQQSTPLSCAAAD